MKKTAETDSCSGEKYFSVYNKRNRLNKAHERERGREGESERVRERE
jgi:hypothetical protein